MELWANLELSYKCETEQEKAKRSPLWLTEGDCRAWRQAVQQHSKGHCFQLLNTHPSSAPCYLLSNAFSEVPKGPEVQEREAEVTLWQRVASQRGSDTAQKEITKMVAWSACQQAWEGRGRRLGEGIPRSPSWKGFWRAFMTTFSLTDESRISKKRSLKIHSKIAAGSQGGKKEHQEPEAERLQCWMLSGQQGKWLRKVHAGAPGWLSPESLRGSLSRGRDSSPMLDAEITF